MKPTLLLTTLALAGAATLAPSALAQDAAFKVGIGAVEGDGGPAIRAALLAGLTDAGFEIVPLEEIDAAIGDANPLTSEIAIKVGATTGAQVIVTGKVLGKSGVVAKIFSTKNAHKAGVLAPEAAMLSEKVAEAITQNKEMLLME